MHGVHEYSGWEPLRSSCEACYSKEGACLNKIIYRHARPRRRRKRKRSEKKRRKRRKSKRRKKRKRKPEPQQQQLQRRKRPQQQPQRQKAEEKVAETKGHQNPLAPRKRRPSCLACSGPTMPVLLVIPVSIFTTKAICIKDPNPEV